MKKQTTMVTLPTTGNGSFPLDNWTIHDTEKERSERSAIIHQYLRSIKGRDSKQIYDTFIALDPGETTGIAFFSFYSLHSVAQLPTKPGNLYAFVASHHLPVVFEDYRVYESKLQEHIGSNVYTLRRIGEIEAACAHYNLPYYSYMASEHKGFSTNDKLKSVGLYFEGMRHALDAVRVGFYYMCG